MSLCADAGPKATVWPYLFARVAPAALGCLLECLLEELVLLRPPLVSARHDNARTRPGVWHAHTLALSRARTHGNFTAVSPLPSLASRLGRA
jgi:hypothetical protein